jgi:ankyrin repeat protein
MSQSVSRVLRLFLPVGYAIVLGGCFLCPAPQVNYPEIAELVRKNQPAPLSTYLDQHPDALEYRDDTKLSPLAIALLHCDLESAKVLIGHHAKIDAIGSGGVTPLHLAAEQGCNEGILLLLKFHASINPRDASGKTPLGLAIAWGQTSAAQLLRNNGGKE